MSDYPQTSFTALQFLHEAGGWLETDPWECRVHRNTLRAFEKNGWVILERDATNRITGCTITGAGHEAYQKNREGGKVNSGCHGCTFHYPKSLPRPTT